LTLLRRSCLNQCHPCFEEFYWSRKLDPSATPDLWKNSGNHRCFNENTSPRGVQFYLWARLL
uniref:Radical SAM protein n=1 Tax=Hymenolepis diminuta TaxID=6216 RepID=A0A0R3SZS7_HYMDI